MLLIDASPFENEISNTILQRIQYRFDAAGNVSGYTNRAGSYTVEQEYVYDGLYQLTGAKGKTESRQYGLIDYRAEYEQAYIFDEAGQGKMMEKVSGTLQSDGRVLGDDLNYRLDYEYAEGYVHRVSRAGKQYYRYDRNGNVTAEQDRAFAEEGGGTEGKAAVTELGNGVYVADTGWGMIEGGAAGGAGWSGGVSKGNRRIYRWNEKNELKGTSDSRYHVEYSYGADGARSGKYSVASDGGSGTETLYFNSMWTWRYDGQAGGVVGRNSKHIYVGDTRVVTKLGKADGSFTGEEKIKQYYYHSDHLGSAQLITNASGEEYERIEYTPYGELWIEKASVATNIDIPYRFTGKEMDSETGLYYYGARYLDPKYSRWLSPDPALGEYIPGAPVNEEARRRNGNLPGMGGVFNTVNLQLYHYAGNNPVKYVDPDGRVQMAVVGAYIMNGGSSWAGTAIKGNRSATIGGGGCAITAAANITATFTSNSAKNPGQINATEGFVKSGSTQWTTIGTAFGLLVSKTKGNFTHNQYKSQNQDVSTIFATLVNVKYDEAGSDHWVGVEGIDTVNGKDYLIISPTSQNDSSVGEGSSRGGQGWMKRNDGKILVPVDKVKEYVNFTRPNAI